MNRVYYGQIPHSEELQHWGILGMKWGIRRYQNPDGSLTAEGRERYSKFKSGVSNGVRVVGKAAAKGAKVVGKTAVKGAKAAGNSVIRKFKIKHPSLMTADELRDYTQRLAAEKSVIDMREYIKSKTGSRAKKVISDIIEDGSKIIARRAFVELADDLFEDPADRYIEAERRKVEYDELLSKKRKLADDRMARDEYQKEISRNKELISLYETLSEPKPRVQQEQVYDATSKTWKLEDTKEYKVWKQRQKVAKERLQEYKDANDEFGKIQPINLPSFKPSSSDQSKKKK